MRLEILFWDHRCQFIMWFNFALPFFETYFYTSWYGGELENEISIRFGSKTFERRWGK